MSHRLARRGPTQSLEEYVEYLVRRLNEHEIRSVATGGTGAETAEAARTNLGLGHVYTGTGDPEGVLTAPVGSLYSRTDGGASTTLYVKEAGAGDTGWAAK